MTIKEELKEAFKITQNGWAGYTDAKALKMFLHRKWGVTVDAVTQYKTQFNDFVAENGILS